MKNVYFVQAAVLYGVNVHLPYAAGCVAAYAWNNPAVRENYRLGHFTFMREPVEQALASFEEPFLVAFSNYVWNFEYHKALAAAVKERWPDCLIVFGGHHIFDDSSEQLNQYPYVDFLIHRAGEIPFEQLLLALLRGESLDGVPSLSRRGADGAPMRTADAPCKSCDFPSPYLAGLFDELIADHPSLLFSMTLETNRGCPYACAFCDWGTVRQGILQMPMERVRAEIDWASRHKIEYICCADGNFGILPRDGAIVDYLVERKRRTGYPVKFGACFAKNSNETVFRLNKTLSDHELNAGATLSFQSVSPRVLENIGRKNLEFGRFRELLSLYNQAGVPVYTELILGLPGETPESFAGGIGKLLAAGMHGALEVFPCEALPNAQLSRPDYRAKYGIETIRVRQYQRHGSPQNQDEIPEYSDIIFQTDSMPVEDWVAAYLFSTVVQGFHGLGLLPLVALYLYRERGLPYERFYSDLIQRAKADSSTLMGELLRFYENRYLDLSRGKGESLMHCDPRFGDVAWPLGEALFLCAAHEAERFYDELPAVLSPYGPDDGLLAELIRYQRTMVQLPAPAPPRQTFAYDFPGYFAAALAGEPIDLQQKRATVLFPSPDPVCAWEEFARDFVWYGRRKGLLSRKGFVVCYD